MLDRQQSGLGAGFGPAFGGVTRRLIAVDGSTRPGRHAARPDGKR